VEKPFDPDGFWRSKVVRDLRPDEIAIFRKLYLWRDKQARALNQPPFKVLTDQLLSQLSQEQSLRIEDLPLNARLASRFGPAIVEAIGRGRSAPAPQPPARRSNGEGRPDADALARFDRLRAWRVQRAAERGVEPDIVLNNETLMMIARACPRDMDALGALGVMGSWKLMEYGPDIVGVMIGPTR
jgi:ribonuclease D